MGDTIGDIINDAKNSSKMQVFFKIKKGKKD
jgi:hypothetical protein